MWPISKYFSRKQFNFSKKPEWKLELDQILSWRFLISKKFKRQNQKIKFNFEAISGTTFC